MDKFCKKIPTSQQAKMENRKERFSFHVDFSITRGGPQLNTQGVRNELKRTHTRLAVYWVHWRRRRNNCVILFYCLYHQIILRLDNSSTVVQYWIALGLYILFGLFIHRTFGPCLRPLSAWGQGQITPLHSPSILPDPGIATPGNFILGGDNNIG